MAASKGIEGTRRQLKVAGEMIVCRRSDISGRGPARRFDMPLFFFRILSNSFVSGPDCGSEMARRAQAGGASQYYRADAGTAVLSKDQFAVVIEVQGHACGTHGRPGHAIANSRGADRRGAYVKVPM
jgi:hypothetical protein